MKHIARLIVVAASLLSFGASAQWQWLDKDGRKVFSDRAPPASVLERDILKRPGQPKPLRPQNGTMAEDASKPTTQAEKGESAQPAASAAKQSGLEKELTERKKKTEQVEADKRKAEEVRISTARADNCERAKSAKSGLNSGVRLSRINKQGEREVMDDAARAVEAKRIESIISTDCK